MTVIVTDSTEISEIGITDENGIIVVPALYKDMTDTEGSVKAVLIFLFLYAMGIGVYFSSRENRRPGEEHGSAKWGSVRSIVKRYIDREDKSSNLIITQTMRLGLNAKKHRRNLNVLVIGGSGAGKTRFYAKPNIMQCNTSFIIADPKGEMLRAVAPLLLEKGYDVKVRTIYKNA